MFSEKQRYSRESVKTWRELLRKLKYDNLFYALTEMGSEVRKKVKDILNKIHPIPNGSDDETPKTQ